MQKRYNSILETIGNTPVVRLNNIGPDHVNLFVKVESFNPMGSVKDRLALGVIEDAERRGELKPGQTIIEATSGNTGIGLAMVCAQKGYPLVVTMAENFSVERRKLLRFLGAKVVLTPAIEKGIGMVRKAQELAEKHGWWQSRQFENPANSDIHASTTGPEIIEAFSDIPLHYWVSGFGTGGTYNGVARVLREQSPETQIVLCEPDNAPVVASGIPQPEQGSHPRFRPHMMQGWSPDFISKIMQDAHAYDIALTINGNRAIECARELACKEGILVGTSGGATLQGALQIAAQAPAGSNILCMLPDTGERYMSTPLFEHIGVDMNEEEMAISCSTDSARFDVSGTTIPPAPIEVSQQAQDILTDTLAKHQGKVVMFSLEWCEFCWSAAKTMEQYGIEFVTENLDIDEYQTNNICGQLREALRQKTGAATVPQLFIDGQFVGGMMDLFDKLKDGRMQRQLQDRDMPFNPDVRLDPYNNLPKWMQARH